MKSVKQETNLLKENLRNEHLERKIAVDKLEQYQRKDKLRVNGIPYNEGESTTQLEDSIIEIANKIGAKINRGDISITHRLKPTPQGIHPVLSVFE